MRIAVIGDKGFVYPHMPTACCSITVAIINAQGMCAYNNRTLQNLFNIVLLDYCIKQKVDVLVVGCMDHKQCKNYTNHGVYVITGVTGRVDDVIAWMCTTCIVQLEKILTQVVT